MDGLGRARGRGRGVVETVVRVRLGVREGVDAARWCGVVRLRVLSGGRGDVGAGVWISAPVSHQGVRTRFWCVCFALCFGMRVGELLAVSAAALGPETAGGFFCGWGWCGGGGGGEGFWGWRGERDGWWRDAAGR